MIANKYRVERVLGRGGMGVVVAATHLELEQLVALKFLLPEAASHPDIASRFGREARAAARIHSEHVARVIDVGSLPTGDPYMVMEYMDGEDLEHALARTGPLPPDVATGYVLEACEAIAEAHALGIIHRDLKPANLFLASRRNGGPIVKVLDFGISKSQLSTSQDQLTKTSSMLGSPRYMSPEQMVSAKSVDVRSDVWALGTVLYELLAGRPPFVAETMPELVAAILQSPHDPLRSHRPEVAVGLEAAVHRCLEKTPARRFANVAELAGAIAPFGPARSEVSVERISHVLGVDARPVPIVTGRPRGPTFDGPRGTIGGGTTAQAVSAPASSLVPAGVPRRGRAVVVAAAVGVVAAVAVAVGLTSMLRMQATGTPAVVAAASAPAPAQSVAGAETPVASVSAPADAPSAAPIPAVVLPPVPVKPAVKPPLRAHPAAQDDRPSAPPASPLPAKNCNPPYVIDAAGHRQYKQECLN